MSTNMETSCVYAANSLETTPSLRVTIMLYSFLVSIVIGSFGSAFQLLDLCGHTTDEPASCLRIGRHS